MKNKIQDKILKKIKSKKINIGIVGVGYVGLNLLIQFAKKKIALIKNMNFILSLNFQDI